MLMIEYFTRSNFGRNMPYSGRIVVTDKNIYSLIMNNSRTEVDERLSDIIWRKHQSYHGFYSVWGENTTTPYNSIMKR